MAGNAPASNSSGKSSAPPGAAPALVPLGHHSKVPPIPLIRPVTLVGSRQNSHIHLLSRQISKAHALLISHEGRVYVRDLASRTHIYVNGVEVREADLKDGDLLKIGSFTFKYQAPAGKKQKPKPDTTPPGQLDVDGGEFPLAVDQRVLLVGRRPTCDISLVEESVSTGHAVIFSMGGKRYVRDLGSRTGTWVNGRKERQAELKFGDVLKIGETTMRYDAAPSDEIVPPEVDEFEDLVGTAPLVDSSLGMEHTPTAPPGDFDSSSPTGRAGKAVADDPLGASAVDLDFELDNEGAKTPGDTAFLPAAEAKGKRPSPTPRPAAKAPAAAPPVASEDDQRFLVGDNLMSEKPSAADSGAGMEDEAREALELARAAGKPRRPTPAVEPPKAPRPPAKSPAPPAPAPIPVEVDEPAAVEPATDLIPVADDADTIPFDLGIAPPAAEAPVPVVQPMAPAPPAAEPPKDSPRRGWFGFGRRREEAAAKPAPAAEARPPVPAEPLFPAEPEPAAAEELDFAPALDATEPAADESAAPVDPLDELMFDTPVEVETAEPLAADFDSVLGAHAGPTIPAESPAAVGVTAHDPAAHEAAAEVPLEAEDLPGEAELMGGDAAVAPAAETEDAFDELDLSGFEIPAAAAPVPVAPVAEAAVAPQPAAPAVDEAVEAEHAAPEPIEPAESAVTDADLDDLMLAPLGHAADPDAAAAGMGVVPAEPPVEVTAREDHDAPLDAFIAPPTEQPVAEAEALPVADDWVMEGEPADGDESPFAEESVVEAELPEAEVSPEPPLTSAPAEPKLELPAPPHDLGEPSLHSGLVEADLDLELAPLAPAEASPAVEVIEPAEPTNESVLDIGESLGLPVEPEPQAEELPLEPPAAESELSDTTFGRQFEDFAAGSAEPIIVEEPAGEAEAAKHEAAEPEAIEPPAAPAAEEPAVVASEAVTPIVEMPRVEQTPAEATAVVGTSLEELAADIPAATSVSGVEFPPEHDPLILLDEPLTFGTAETPVAAAETPVEATAETPALPPAADAAETVATTSESAKPAVAPIVEPAAPLATPTAAPAAAAPSAPMDSAVESADMLAPLDEADLLAGAEYVPGEPSVGDDFLYPLDDEPLPVLTPRSASTPAAAVPPPAVTAEHAAEVSAAVEPESVHVEPVFEVREEAAAPSTEPVAEAELEPVEPLLEIAEGPGLPATAITSGAASESGAASRHPADALAAEGQSEPLGLASVAEPAVHSEPSAEAPTPAAGQSPAEAFVAESPAPAAEAEAPASSPVLEIAAEEAASELALEPVEPWLAPADDASGAFEAAMPLVEPHYVPEGTLPDAEEAQAISPPPTPVEEAVAAPAAIETDSTELDLAPVETWTEPPAAELPTVVDTDAAELALEPVESWSEPVSHETPAATVEPDPQEGMAETVAADLTPAAEPLMPGESESVARHEEPLHEAPAHEEPMVAADEDSAVTPAGLAEETAPAADLESPAAVALSTPAEPAAIEQPVEELPAEELPASEVWTISTESVVSEDEVVADATEESHEPEAVEAWDVAEAAEPQVEAAAGVTETAEEETVEELDFGGEPAAELPPSGAAGEAASESESIEPAAAREPSETPAPFAEAAAEVTADEESYIVEDVTEEEGEPSPALLAQPPIAEEPISAAAAPEAEAAEPVEEHIVDHGDAGESHEAPAVGAEAAFAWEAAAEPVAEPVSEPPAEPVSQTAPEPVQPPADVVSSEELDEPNFSGWDTAVAGEGDEAAASEWSSPEAVAEAARADDVRPEIEGLGEPNFAGWDTAVAGEGETPLDEIPVDEVSIGELPPAGMPAGETSVSSLSGVVQTGETSTAEAYVVEEFFLDEESATGTVSVPAAEAPPPAAEVSPVEPLAPAARPPAAEPEAELPGLAGSDLRSAELAPQAPLAGLGFFDLGTDQASFLGGLPLILNEVSPPPPTFGTVGVEFEDPQAAAMAEAPQAAAAPGVEPAAPSAEPELEFEPFDDLPPEASAAAETVAEAPIEPAPVAEAVAEAPVEPRKTKLFQQNLRIPAPPGRRPRGAAAEPAAPFGGPPAGDNAGFGEPTQIFGGLATSGRTIDVFSQGFSADLSTDPVFGNTVKEIPPSRPKRKPLRPTPPPPVESEDVAEMAEQLADDLGGAVAPPEAPPHSAPPEETPSEAFDDQGGLPPADAAAEEFPSPEEADQLAPAAAYAAPRMAVSVPQVGHRGRGKGVAVLLVLMLLLMAASFVAIYSFLKPRFATDGTIQYENFTKLTTGEARELENQQTAMLGTAAMQDAAKRQFRVIEPEMSYGWLDDVVDFSKNPGRVSWQEQKPGELRFRFEGSDRDGDPLRVKALLLAMHTLNTEMRNKAMAGEDTLKRAQRKLDLETAQLAKLEADRAALLARQNGGPDEAALKKLEADAAAAEQKWRAARDVALTAEAELKKLETALTAGPSASGSAASIAGNVPPADADLDALQKNLEAMTTRLETARKNAADQAEQSRKAFDDSIGRLQQSFDEVQGAMKDSPELAQYVAAAQKLVEMTRKMSGTLLDRQQKTFDHLLELKKTVDAKIELRQKELYATDREIKRLKDELAMHERGYHAATDQDMAEEAAKIRKEMDVNFADISKRKRELEADSALSTLNDVSADLKQRLADSQKQMDDDRKESEGVLAELEQNVKNSAAIEKLPDAQKALAQQLTAKLEALNSARKSYLDAQKSQNAEASAGMKMLEQQVQDATAKVEQRRMIVTAHDQQAMTAEEKEHREAAVAAKRAELAAALAAREKAEQESFDTGKAVAAAKRDYADSRHAAEELQAKNIEWDPERVTLGKSIAQLTDQINNAPAARPFPKEPVVGQATEITDPRPLYTAVSWGGIVVVFAGLILMAALRGDKPQTVLPISGQHAYAQVSPETRSALA